MSETTDSLISVVIPAYNAEKHIAKTLESVCRQTHRNIEVLVVDDGSSDNTAAMVDAIARTDGRVRLLKSSHHGVSHARNYGIARARGEFVATIDADDLWKPEKLARQLAILRDKPRETGVVYCWAAGIDDTDNIVMPVWAASHASGNVLHDIVERGILSCGSTPLIRKEYIVKVGGYDEDLHLAEDWKFYTALAGVCSFEVIPECLTGYRLRTDSASLSLLPMQLALDRCTKWIRATWPEIPAAVMQEREFMLGIYLAFMAIRERRYFKASEYLMRAAWLSPGKLLGLQIWELVTLIPAHALGLRRYEWQLWRRPEKFQ